MCIKCKLDIKWGGMGLRGDLIVFCGEVEEEVDKETLDFNAVFSGHSLGIGGSRNQSASH